ncbi:tetratricopeptide repeat protein [Calothrix sp. NIES-3974]|uniref:tetratricopeptide repeat protein n=1 Tax=Calothrix sp. NIES-3974 TaxID=2005462 RepID=UPI000B60C04C|nr:tetratricopeptide repeat protein [Calothrix sp. NIES-3974]BAZ07767.1 hypothetical protein NIES3974_44320 [Calothrix sp. NIES-3974]
MLEEVANAFTHKDYGTAAKLLKKLFQESPDDLWVQFYIGQLKEVSGKEGEAEKIYKRILRKSSHHQLTLQARKALQRLEVIPKQSQPDLKPVTDEPGLLILEPIPREQKQQAAQQLAKIMQIDPYTARLQLPSRGWRYYKTGGMGELTSWGEALQTAAIPCFWVDFAAISQIQIFQVDYFQPDTNQPRVTCRHHRTQGSLAFNWSEVTDKTTGLLPIFEQVVDINLRRQLERKTQTQDYANICDLHLPGRNSILRICDRAYQFSSHPLPSSTEQNTLRSSWNQLQQWLNQQLPQIPTWSEFTPFAESILDQTEILSKFDPQMNLHRPQPSFWDNAFQLYSCLIFLKNIK